MQISTPNDHQRGVITYDRGNGEILRIFQSAQPLDPKKAELADVFGTEDLPWVVGQLTLHRYDALPGEAGRKLLVRMREIRPAANAFERVANVSGHGFLEAWNGAIDGVQAARFGDKRYENRVAEFLSLVDRLFPAIYQAAEDEAIASLDKTPAKK